MKIDRVFNSKQEEEREEKFYKAIMTLSNLDEHKANKHANGEYSEQFRVGALGVVAGVGIEKAAQKLMLHESTLRSWMTSRGENYCSECHKSFRFQSHLKNHMKLHKGKEGKPVRTFKEKKPNSICPELLLQHFRPNSICPEMLLQYFRTNWEFCETGFLQVSSHFWLLDSLNVHDTDTLKGVWKACNIAL